MAPGMPCNSDEGDDADADNVGDNFDNNDGDEGPWCWFIGFVSAFAARVVGLDWLSNQMVRPSSTRLIVSASAELVRFIDIISS